MINPKHNPVEWARLIDELSEAQEHLGTLISKLGGAPEYDEEWFRVDMGHLMAHLNLRMSVRVQLLATPTR
jgi:hypothetical protein